MEKKLGLEPAFAQPIANDGTGAIYSAYEKSHWEGGMSKRFYAANNYAEVAYRYAENLTPKYIMLLLGLNDTIYDAAIHFPMILAKFQYQFADELLKQENL